MRLEKDQLIKKKPYTYFSSIEYDRTAISYLGWKRRFAGCAGNGERMRMRIDGERPGLPGDDVRPHVRGRGLPGRVLSFAAGAVLLVLVFTLSVLLFAALVAGGLLVWGYLWWKTRELRKQMRERPPGGRVIEGEVIRDAGSDDRDER